MNPNDFRMIEKFLEYGLGLRPSFHNLEKLVYTKVVRDHSILIHLSSESVEITTLDLEGETLTLNTDIRTYSDFRSYFPHRFLIN